MTGVTTGNKRQMYIYMCARREGRNSIDKSLLANIQNVKYNKTHVRHVYLHCHTTAVDVCTNIRAHDSSSVVIW